MATIEDWPDLTRTEEALRLFDAGDGLSMEVGKAFALDTADRNPPEVATLIRPGPAPGELSFVRRLVLEWRKLRDEADLNSTTVLLGAGETFTGEWMQWQYTWPAAADARVRDEHADFSLQFQQQPPPPPPGLTAWVWYHRTMDTADRQWPVVARGVMNDLHRKNRARIMNAARALVRGTPQPHDAIDIAKRMYVEQWSPAEVEARVPGFAEFRKWADAQMPRFGRSVVVPSTITETDSAEQRLRITLAPGVTEEDVIRGLVRSGAITAPAAIALLGALVPPTSLATPDILDD